MSTTANPTTSPLTSDQLTVIAATFPSLVFFVVIVVLLSIIYRKDPKCCRVCSYQESQGDMNMPPQYCCSRQTLVGSPYVEDTQMGNTAQPTAGPLFYVGLPSCYSLPPLEDPVARLPSYESVRKKDRQRQIHMMIADRFGLNGPIMTEPPPTYEESIRQSVDMPYSLLSSTLDLSHTQDVCPVHSSQANTQTLSHPASSILPL